jgi:hypothetical protein
VLPLPEPPPDDCVGRAVDGGRLPMPGPPGDALDNEPTLPDPRPDLPEHPPSMAAASAAVDKTAIVRAADRRRETSWPVRRVAANGARWVRRRIMPA